MNKRTNNQISVKGNLLKIKGKQDFESGTLQNLTIENCSNVSTLKIAKNATMGSYISPFYKFDLFDCMVCSWNASIPEGSSVEILARVQINNAEKLIWTKWLTWGKFSPYIRSGTTEGKDCEEAHIDREKFYIDKGTALLVQIKAVLRREDINGRSPLLRQINMTTTGVDTQPLYAEEEINLPKKVYNKAPACCQQIRDKYMGHSICSPTTIQMMLLSRLPKTFIFPELGALGQMDYGVGLYGNWSYATSYLACFGFEAYNQFANKKILMQELAKGHTVGMRVVYGSPNVEVNKYPILDGTYKDTQWHLLTVIGYEYKQDIVDNEHLVFYCSDSHDCGEKDADKYCYREYKWTQLSKCWTPRMLYICPEIEPTISGELAYKKMDLELKEVKKNKYEAWSGGKKINLCYLTGQNGCICSYVDGESVNMYEKTVDTSHSCKYKNPMNIIANNYFTYYYPDEYGLIEYLPKKGKAVRFCIADSFGHFYTTII